MVKSSELVGHFVLDVLGSPVPSLARPVLVPAGKYDGAAAAVPAETERYAFAGSRSPMMVLELELEQDCQSQDRLVSGTVGHCLAAGSCGQLEMLQTRCLMLQHKDLVSGIAELDAGERRGDPVVEFGRHLSAA